MQVREIILPAFFKFTLALRRVNRNWEHLTVKGSVGGRYLSYREL